MNSAHAGQSRPDSGLGVSDSSGQRLGTHASCALPARQRVSIACCPAAAGGCGARGDFFFFFFITLQPKVERYTSL